MNKIAYVIPGFHGSTDYERYQSVINAFELQNFKVIPITIDWNRRVMSDYVQDFFSQLDHNEDDEVCLFGFSFGAMIAIIAATKLKPNTLILCSLSSFFKEDLKYVKKSWKKYVGKNRMSDFKNFSFNKIIAKIKCKTIIILGKREDKTLIKKAKNVHKRVKNSVLYIVDARHDISNENYQNKILEIIKGL